MESRLAREMADVVVAKTIHITDVLPLTNAKDGSTRSSYHYEMAPWETAVIVDTNTTSAFTIYLPPVAEAAGKIYTIAIIGYSYDVTIDDIDGDTEDFTSDIMTANYDRAALYSDGIHWYWLVNMCT